MTSGKDIATDLLRRLLAGERGQVGLHLSMLLEKAYPVAASDETYRQILPPELADIHLSAETAKEITALICTEISRNPRESLISAVSFTGAEVATKTAANVLANPPRPLTMGEYASALSIVGKYLPGELSEQPEFLPKAELERLIQVAKQLKNVAETGTVAERSARITAKHHAAGLLESLRSRGIIEN